MKYAILAVIVLAMLSVTGAASAAVRKPAYCGTSTWAVNYAKIYQYPTGSYWQKQISLWPEYYTQYNSYYLSKYGC